MAIATGLFAATSACRSVVLALKPRMFHCKMEVTDISAIKSESKYSPCLKEELIIAAGWGPETVRLLRGIYFGECFLAPISRAVPLNGIALSCLAPGSGIAVCLFGYRRKNALCSGPDPESQVAREEEVVWNCSVCLCLC